MAPSDPSARPSDGERLVRLIEDMLREQRPAADSLPAVRENSRLDRDLGLDSMARAELLVRMEQAFDVRLPQRALEGDTPAELLDALERALNRPAAADAGRRFVMPGAVDDIPRHAGVLTEVLDWHAETHPERSHVLLYEDDSDEPRPIGYGELGRQARQVAGALRARGVAPGQSVALMLPTGLDYLASFFGVLYAGAVPVPVYPPMRASQLEEHLRRHGRLLANAQAVAMVTVPRVGALARLLRAEAPELRDIVTASDLAGAGDAEPAAARAPDDLALLQYTSGSTGEPKGVMLSHAQLLANIRAMAERIRADSTDVFVSWLPLYHDMGLIAAWLGSLYYGMPLVLMSPLDFLTRPLNWLERIHRHGGSISGAPNFGYELCLRAAQGGDLQHLDLSRWRIAFSGAEPVSPLTLERFAEHFAPQGLQREALCPVYGLAEAGVGLAVPPPGRGPRLEGVDRDRLLSRGLAEPCSREADGAVTMVGCGLPLPGYEIRVVDTEDRELPERREGRVQFSGPSATDGYFRNPEATRALRHGDWLDTGDRGYLADGELFISGREKDVIVRGGRNIYPYELEEAVGGIEGVRRGCVAAFGSTEPDSGTELLVVVAETRTQDPAARQRLEEQIRERAVDVTGIPADRVALVAPHSVLKTSSGKIRRGATRTLYETGRLGMPRAAVWRQLLRLAAATAWERARRRMGQAGAWLAAGWAWVLFGLAAGACWPLVLVLPGRRLRWRVCRAAARVVCRLSGFRLECSGLEQLQASGGHVLVANHASYLDALVLSAALPPGYRFLAKRELAGRWPVRVVLARLGTLFVERFDLQQATADAEALTAAVAAGDRVACFPEGTFSRAPGLGRFQVGAFLAAARAGQPVVPVALAGTRERLRGVEWFPRPGPVSVAVGPPLDPRGSDWAAASELSHRARAFIARRCGDPDLLEESRPQ